MSNKPKIDILAGALPCKAFADKLPSELRRRALEQGDQRVRSHRRDKG